MIHGFRAKLHGTARIYLALVYLMIGKAFDTDCLKHMQNNDDKTDI